MPLTEAERDLEIMFRAALASADPYAMVKARLRLDGSLLDVEGVDGTVRVDMADYGRIVVLGAGKASAPMARALAELLGRPADESLVAVKYGHTDAGRGPIPGIRVVEAGHPVPDAAGAAAASGILDMARRCDRDTLAFVLISGGGSALLASPAPGLSLADKQDVTKLLLASGADIRELNCVRKHLSAIKGGRLAEALFPARVVCLVLSDVVGDCLDAIASGPCVPDSSGWADVGVVIDRYGLRSRLSSPVASILERGLAGDIPDTPKAGAEAFMRVSTAVLGSNYGAVIAARDQAERLGYRPLVLGSMASGEAREVAKFLAGMCLDQRRHAVLGEGDVVIISGGETTVTLRGNGKGGRNQELALAFLAELARADPRLSRGITLLSASTDGNDGPTDAAGAFASAGMLAAARELGLDPGAFLARNDSYSFFDILGSLLRTGPTGTNVCDLQLALVERADLSAARG